MKISIALCTYNGEKFLAQQLESILNQSLQPDEIIVCDDKSNDSTMHILKEFEKKYCKIIKIKENPDNLGFVKNFEKAISLCSGDIIFLSDQDDIWQRNKIERFVELFEKNPQCSYIFSNAELISMKGTRLHQTLWDSIKFGRRKQKLFSKGFQKELLLKKNFVQGAALAIRGEATKFILPFSTRFFHDHWIVLILSMLQRSSGLLLPERLIKYRIHDKQHLGLDFRNVFVKQFVYIRNLLINHTDEFNERIAKLTDIKARIFEFDDFSAKSRDYITDLISFYKIRNQMYQEKKVARVKLIMKLLKKGYYKKFSFSNLVACKEMFEKLLLH